MLSSERAYLAILGVLIVERILEIAISKRNARRAFARGAIEYGRGHFPIMVATHTMFIASCAAESIFVTREISPVISMLALVAALLAQVLRYAAAIALGERWNTRIILTPGAALVTRGPFRWMRHPNYLAVVIEIAAYSVDSRMLDDGSALLHRKRADAIGQNSRRRARA